ncbi:MAG: 30S ribosomal protein S20 [Candidatus Obscuribacterales bacterium]|nr:30S ribosomal protein S20 [Candidatus Obscuribacterales bacterium]
MPNIKSAIKRVEVAERNRLRNRSWKSAIRTQRNEVESSVKVADPAKASEALKGAYSIIDKAVSKGILHKNSAARKKSRLAAQILKLSGKSK